MVTIPTRGAAAARNRRSLGFHRITICLSPSVSPSRAVDIACALLAPRRGSLTAIAAIEVALDLPLETSMVAAESRARETVEIARAVAASQRVSLEGVVLHARDAGPAIVAEIALLHTQLVVIAEGPRPSRNASHLSRTTGYILHHAACRVMLIGGQAAAGGKRSSAESGPSFRSDRPHDYWPVGEFIDRVRPARGTHDGSGPRSSAQE